MKRLEEDVGRYAARRDGAFMSFNVFPAVTSADAQACNRGGERIFSFWGYGETEKLSPGSEPHVSRTGLAANPHFVLSVHETGYRFEPGLYEIDVIADVVGHKEPIKFATIELSLSDELSAALQEHEGVLFERKIGGEYEGHARER